MGAKADTRLKGIPYDMKNLKFAVIRFFGVAILIGKSLVRYISIMGAIQLAFETSAKM